MDRKQAFLAQARSDLRLYRRLAASREVESCHALHFLQMGSEKLAKAAGGALGHDWAQKRQHASLGKLLLAMAANPKAWEKFGMSSKEAFRAHLKGLREVADEVERLAPSLAADGPNCEYPWRPVGTSDDWAPPCEATFHVLSARQSVKLAKLVGFVDALARNFDRVFT